MKNKLAVFAALCGLFVLITASAQAVQACRAGLRLCAELILPSLFPFFVLSALLAKLGLPAQLGERLAPLGRRLFRVSGAGCTALLMGLLGGYPLGAAYIAELCENGCVDEEEAGRLLAFCNNSGPAFFLGALGTGVFGSPRLGLLLYAVHVCAALLTGLLLRGRGPFAAEASPDAAPPLPFSKALPEAVRQAVSASLNVCGFVVCFAVFTGLMNANGFFSLLAGRLAALSGQPLPWCRALLTGFFELGGGIGAEQVSALRQTRQHDKRGVGAALLQLHELALHRRSNGLPVLRPDNPMPGNPYHKGNVSFSVPHHATSIRSILFYTL